MDSLPRLLADMIEASAPRRDPPADWLTLERFAERLAALSRKPVATAEAFVDPCGVIRGSDGEPLTINIQPDDVPSRRFRVDVYAVEEPETRRAVEEGNKTGDALKGKST